MGCRREVLDGFMRNRAKWVKNLINATVHKLDIPKTIPILPPYISVDHRRWHSGDSKD